VPDARPKLFKNLRAHTLAGRAPQATWFTVLGNRFQRVGRGEPPPCRDVVDLDGHTVVPGFVDSHIHFFQTGLDLLFVNLSTCRSVDDVIEQLRTREVGPRSWRIAHSFEEDGLVDGPLTKEHLDAAFGAQPVWVNRIDYHSAVVNSAALKRLDIPPDTRGVVMKGGEPCGVLRANAYMLAKPKVARQVPLALRGKAVKEAVHACVSRGITAVHALEGGPLFGDEGVHELLKVSDRLPIDMTLFLQEKNLYFTKQLGFDHLGGCILIDGSIGSYTAAAVDEHGCACGTLYESERSLRTFVAAAHKAGAQLAFHAIGSRAIEVLLNTYEKALDKQPKFDHRHRIEHFELATDAQIARAADLGLVVAMQPSFEHFWGGPDGMYANRLGDGWKQTNRFRSILDGGVVIAGGSDANVTPPDPLLGMQAAMCHPNAEQRVSGEEALRMMTMDAAYAAHNDDRHGSIEAGKEASFVVLDRDPLNAPADEVAAIRVRETWSRGRCVHRIGREDPPWADAQLQDDVEV